MGSEDAAAMAFAGLAFIGLCVAGAIAAIAIGAVIIYKLAKRRRDRQRGSSSTAARPRPPL